VRSDCHVHVRGDEKSEDILREMDRAGLDLVCIISSAPQSQVLEMPAKKRVSDLEDMKMMGRMVEADRERIKGFWWLDPTVPDAADLVERAVADYGCSGIKMIPNHWHVYEERFFPAYERIEKMNVPILFHTGILWGNNDCSRFCHPADLEILERFPKLRFSMAHIGWPWTDEGIAVADRFKTMARLKDGRDPEIMKDVVRRNVNVHEARYEVPIRCFGDLTPGTPAAYRREQLQLCYEVLGADALVYGTDGSSADRNLAEREKFHRERDERIFRELGVLEADIERIMGSNVLKWLGKK